MMCPKIPGYKNERGCSGYRLAATFKFILNFVLNLKAYKQLKELLDVMWYPFAARN